MTRRTVLTALALLALPVSADEPAPQWTLVQVDGQAPGYAATLMLDGAGKVVGQAPCNRWFGSVEGVAPDFTISDLTSTEMACAGLAQEQEFFALLKSVTTIEQTGATLTLRGTEHVLGFAAADN